MKLVVASLAVLAALCLQGEAKTFTRCQLVAELKKHNINQLRDWVCLIEGESSRRTDVIGPTNSNGSRDHGLFQINDRYWCNNGSKPGKACNVTCAELRTDDITKAVQCARTIYKAQGWDAWVAWRNNCKGKPLPDISMC
ncbi:hypothetical protein ACJJTC_004776 [Scirpophaga incertulas]